MYGSVWCWDFYKFKMSDYGDLFYSLLCSTKNRIQIGFEFEKRQIFEIRGCEFSANAKFGQKTTIHCPFLGIGWAETNFLWQKF